jgi:hypothetical protein
MNAITLFSFGYYGWGNATEELVKCVDAVERGRGFLPPVFVDTRISRSVRAKGFNGSAFANLLGESRHRWMRSLGNKRIETRTGPAIQIAKPEAADTLLDAAIEHSEKPQRILFFCSCPFPKAEGKTACHRDVIGTLLLKAAKKRGLAIEVTEWPGGEPDRRDWEVTAEDFRSLQRGRRAIPLRTRFDLAEWAAMPCGSTVTLHFGDETLHRVAGPVRMTGGEWNLPVFSPVEDPEPSLKNCEQFAKTLRKQLGFEPRRTT